MPLSHSFIISYDNEVTVSKALKSRSVLQFNGCDTKQVKIYLLILQYICRSLDIYV